MGRTNLDTIGQLLTMLEQGNDRQKIRMITGVSDSTLDKYISLYNTLKFGGVDAMLNNKYCTDRAAKLMIERYGLTVTPKEKTSRDEGSCTAAEAIINAINTQGRLYRESLDEVKVLLNELIKELK